MSGEFYNSCRAVPHSWCVTACVFKINCCWQCAIINCIRRSCLRQQVRTGSKSYKDLGYKMRLQEVRKFLVHYLRRPYLEILPFAKDGTVLGDRFLPTKSFCARFGDRICASALPKVKQHSSKTLTTGTWRKVQDERVASYFMLVIPIKGKEAATYELCSIFAKFFRNHPKFFEVNAEP